MTATDPPVPFDLTEPIHVHLIGIGGAGMSSIAIVLLGMGHVVSGSDARDSAVLGRLRSGGATTFVGHRAEHVVGADLVVRSSAVRPDNPELVAARSAGVPTLDRTAFLPLIAGHTPFVSISGTHGKTTTSSMTTVALDSLGTEPSFLVGSRIHALDASARYSGGRFMVLEADESDGSFLAGPRVGALVTNIEPDHLDHWGGWDALVDAFEAFLDHTDGPRVVCVDDPTLARMALAANRDGRPLVGYGFSEEAEYRILDATPTSDGIGGDVLTPEGTVHLQLGVPGRHNLLNAAGALALVSSLGHDPADVAAALETYRGVARRFEARGETDGVRFVDDYAHHPTELRAALAAGRTHTTGRLVAVYQPHRYTRTAALWDDFASTFDGVDVLVVTDVYPAGEEPIPGIDSQALADAIRAGSDVGRVEYAPDLADAARRVAELAERGDLVMSLGAGDVTVVADMVIEEMTPLDEPRFGPQDAERLVAELGAVGLDVIRDHPLGPLCTYRVGGSADVFVRVDDAGELERLAGVTSRTPTLTAAGTDLVHVIGKGSNMLVSDRGVAGLVVQLGDAFTDVEIVDRTDGEVLVGVGAAALMPTTARRLAAEGVVGFEWAVGIPGSLGGAVRMNAGGHGSEMAEVLRRVHLIDLRSGEARWMDVDELQLGYRRSVVEPHQVVTSVELALGEGDPTVARERLSEIVHWRRENQPGGPNAGSVFTNPAGDSAGRLIDMAGCRGLRLGTAEVSPKHANFIQADPGGSADDVMALMQEVVRRVAERHGIELHAETILLGFPDRDVRVVKPGPRRAL